MDKLKFLIFLFAICSCTNKKTELLIYSNEINLSAAVRAMEDYVSISELVDSITFVPLETRSNNLLGGHGVVNLTPEYIYYSNACFDWNGRFVHKIGKLGQGPCEEPGEGVGSIAFINDHFYSSGMKFIEYDINGECTGKEKNLYRIDKMDPVGKLFNLQSLKRTGNNLVSFHYPDTVFFFNTDFDIVGRYPIMKWKKNSYAHPLESKYFDFFTYYNDTVVFYNYYTDTIYHATENTLIPRWILRMDENDRVSTNFLYIEEELLREAFNFWEAGKLDQARICELLNNKINVLNVHETETKIFMLGHFTVFACKLRNIPCGKPPFLAFLDKRTGVLRAAKNFKDDLCGLENFMPTWGICHNKMVSIIWPYELDELIQQKQDRGEKVSKKLLELADKVDIEDNPILIFAHLKK